MVQIADLLLYPVAKGGYDPSYKPYVDLMKAGRLIDAHLSAENRPNLGIKYSCFKSKRSLRTLIRFGQRLALTPERCSTCKLVHVRLFYKFFPNKRRSQPAERTNERSGRGDMSRAETLRRADSGCDSSFKHRWYALATAQS